MATLPSPGEVFGAYDVVRVVGRGPSGVVLQAVHRERQTSVALKVLLPSVAGLRGYRDYFLQQARVLAGLGSAHVVAVHEAGVEGRLLFVTTDLLGGGDVGQLLARTGPLAPALAVRLMAQAARGLADLHAAGLVHGDLKASNVLLRAGTDTGPGDAVLCDVGLPRVSEATVVSGRSRGRDATVVAGGPVVPGTGLAPEHQDGRPPTVGSDVHELGCVLWELLTGAVPSPTSSSASVPRLPDPHPAELDAVLAHTLAPDPAARYRSAADLHAALAALDGRLAGAPAVLPDAATQVRPSGPPPPAPPRPVEAPAMSWPQSPIPRPGPAHPWPPTPPRRRRGRLVAAGVAVLVLAGAATAGALVLSGGGDPAPTSSGSSAPVTGSPTPTASGAPDLTPPQVGDCRKLIKSDLDEASNDSPTVPCGDGATAQTVFVGTIDTRAPTEVSQATSECFRPEVKLLGVPLTALGRAGIYYIPFEPDDAQWAAGARWVRCDVYVRLTHLVDLPADLGDIFVKGVPHPRYKQCLEESYFGVSCRSSLATYDFAGAFQLDRPLKQPGRAGLNDLARPRCTALAGPKWYASWYTEDNWNAGLRTITCWAPR